MIKAMIIAFLVSGSLFGASERILGDFENKDALKLFAQGESGINAAPPIENGELESVEPLPVETSTNEANASKTNIDVNKQGLTNVEIFEPLLDTPLKRYNARTADHIFWRTDALIFISIPFSFLWSTLLKELIRNFSVAGAFLEGARAPVLSAVNFPYTRDNYPAGSADPLDIFTWANMAVWPVVVAVNDIIERASVPESYERSKKRMRKNRFYRDLILQNFY